MVTEALHESNLKAQGRQPESSQLCTGCSCSAGADSGSEWQPVAERFMWTPVQGKAMLPM